MAIVSESMAKKFWPAAARSASACGLQNGPWLRVVGVCGDVVHDWFDGARADAVPADGAGAGRRAGVRDPDVPAIRWRSSPMRARRVARVDRGAAAVRDHADAAGAERANDQPAVHRAVMAAFAGLALLLAILGLYAVMTYLVAQRVREIGVRIALGATGADVTRLTLSQAARLTAIGVAIGLVLAVALGRAMEGGPARHRIHGLPHDHRARRVAGDDSAGRQLYPCAPRRVGRSDHRAARRMTGIWGWGSGFAGTPAA